MNNSSGKKNKKRFMSKRTRKRCLAVVCLTVALALIVGIVFYTVRGINKLKEMNESEKKKNGTRYTGYNLYTNYIDSQGFFVKDYFYFAQDSNLSCINIEGRVIWSEKLDDEGAMLFSGEDFVAVTKNGKKTLCAYNENGLWWEKTFDGEIITVKTAASADIMLVAYSNDTENEAVSAFSFTDGVITDISKKPVSSSYVTAVAINDAGTRACIATVGGGNEGAGTKLTVYDVEKGSAFHTEFIKDKILSALCFAGNDRVVAAGENSVYITPDYTTVASADASSEIISFGTGEGTVNAVSTGKGEKICIACTYESGNTELLYYGVDGSCENSVQIAGTVLGVIPYDENYLCYTNSKVLIVDDEGMIISEVTDYTGITQVSKGSEGEFLVYHGNGVEALAYTSN